MTEHHYFVHILTNNSRHPLYLGVTHSVRFRHGQHKEEINPSLYTAKYNLKRLVYYERYQYVKNAIARKKQLTGWSRKKKIALTEANNPGWDDLSRFEPGFEDRNQHKGPSTRSRRKLQALAQDDKVCG